MEQTNPLIFEARLTSRDLFRFSMYHMSRGIMGIFNVLFPVGALVLMIASWNASSASYKLILVLCILMFTVWQPYTLYKKAERQAKADIIRLPMTLSFSAEGIAVEQEGKHGELVWDKVRRAELAWGTVMIYTDKIHAYLLPESILGEKKEALCTLMRQQLPKSRRKRI